MTLTRYFENKKVEPKAEVIRLWKEGEKVSEIAKKISVSRDTIYRWLEGVDKNLAAPTKRTRHLVDERTRFKIIELYILMRAPSMRVLSEELASVFAIRLSPSQLRRYLIKWKIFDYKCSQAFESIIRQKTLRQAPLRKSRGGRNDVEMNLKELERFEFSAP